VDINSDCELLERISRFHPKRLHVIINWGSLSHGYTKDAHNY
jgi:hypothetical protein